MCSSSSGETSSANRALVPPTSATRRGQLPSFLLGLEVAMKTLLVSSVREVREGAAAIGPRCLLVLTRRPVRKEGCNGQHAGLPSVGCQAPWGASRLTVGYVPLCGSFILIALLFRTVSLVLESAVDRRGVSPANGRVHACPMAVRGHEKARVARAFCGM